MEDLGTKKISTFLNNLLTQAKKHIDSNDLMILSVALNMMSVILGTKVHSYAGSGNKLYSNIWMMIIAQSGVGSKTTTVNTIQNMLLSSVIDTNFTSYKHQMKKYKTLTKDEKEETAIPNLKQVLNGQGSTFQGMIKSLEKNPHGMTTIFDEAGEFLKKFSKDTENKAAITSLYDQAYYAKSLVGGSGKGEDIYIKNPFLSILALTNPHSLVEETTDTDYLSGFLNRFSIIEIKKFPARQPFKTMEPQNFSKFQDTSLKIWETLDKLYSSEKPLILRIDKIESSYKDWYYEMNIKYQESEECIQSFLPRQQTAALKYAMIIQVFDAVYQNRSLDNMEYLELEYMEIGFYFAEIYMRSINKHIEDLADIESSINTKKSISVEKLADKLITYLTHKDRIGKKYNKSQLTNAIRDLTADNFYDTIDTATKKHEALSIYSYNTIGKKDVPQYYIEAPSLPEEEMNTDDSVFDDYENAS